MAKKPRLTIPEIDCTTTRLSSFRCSTQRTRTSIIPQYSISINGNVNDSQVDDEDQNDALTAFILKPMWNICRVSPLHNMHYNQTKFKQYALKLKQNLAANVKSSSTVKYKVDFKVIKNLKLEVNHSDAVQVKVSSSDDTKENDARIVYEGILFSWGKFAAHEDVNVTHLPLLMDNGRANIAVSVRQCLMKLFDCVITPLTFTQSDLLFFSALLSSFMPTEGSKLVNFLYNVPVTRNATTIDISMTAKDVHNIWLSCFPNGEGPKNILVEQSSVYFFNAFQKFIEYVYEFNVGRLELINVKYPSVTIHNKGKIQLKDPVTAKYTLRILCEMAVILKGPIPKLASDYD
ncbi:centromere protein L-like [Arctopsyche grandis]|uniref:centromere protein L-like n=1 Tax=Arctopsyche grandis TaxID=121162 RepID=UPI00406D8210